MSWIASGYESLILLADKLKGGGEIRPFESGSGGNGELRCHLGPAWGVPMSHVDFKKD